MTQLRLTGILLTTAGLLAFVMILLSGKHNVQPEHVRIENPIHRTAFIEALEHENLHQENLYTVAAISRLKAALRSAQERLEDTYDPETVPVQEWAYKIGDWRMEQYLIDLVSSTSSGAVAERPWLYFTLTFGFMLLGGFFLLFSQWKSAPNDYYPVYHNSLTKGIDNQKQRFLIILSTIALLIYGYFYMSHNIFWPVATLVITAIIVLLARRRPTEKYYKTSSIMGMLGITLGVFLILFYIVLYWAPAYLHNGIRILDPISEAINGGPASQWFLYGFMYTLVVLVMGIRMLIKYRKSPYQKIRTVSVIFFQTAFAFLIPEILVRFNMPWYDFKNIWPLNYSFFFDYNLDQLISSGSLGIFMLVWGIVLILIAVPVLTYFYGKRWYCSWVCGCGGLAETLGDPFRHLSDKSIKSWKYERYIVHGVLVFALIMTILVLYTYFTGRSQILWMDSYAVRKWYGFLIGSAFAGVVGTGFYPLMGNRVWCRFGCPLAAYLGLVQRFKSRFRITTNGGQCISCGNCSTYCEMGIDVRAYAQRGQNIVRSSCVGCGICAEVCPRGVLRLENADDDDRTRTIPNGFIMADEVRIL